MPTETTAPSQSLITRIADMQDIKEYQELNWEGSFEDYLNLVREDPSVLRSACLLRS